MDGHQGIEYEMTGFFDLVCRAEDFRRVFGSYGELVDISLPRDYYSGRLKGFAFVEYPSLVCPMAWPT